MMQMNRVVIAGYVSKKAEVKRLPASGRKAPDEFPKGFLDGNEVPKDGWGRALVYAANMMNAGLDAIAACQVAMINPITDDIELADALLEIVQAHFSA